MSPSSKISVAFLSLLSVLLTSGSARAQDVLLPFGESWIFALGTRAPSPGPEWTRLEFDDSDWGEGQLGIGYGDGDDATVVEGMVNNYSSIFLRRQFTVGDPGGPQNLILSADFDDGLAGS